MKLRPAFVAGLFALSASSALLARVAAADQDGVVAALSGGSLLVTVYSEAAHVHFEYNTTSCDKSAPCFAISASLAAVGVPMSAPSNCKVKSGGAYTPGSIACPADGVGGITFMFTKGGNWSAYAGGAGQHTGTSCSPVPVTIQTGPGTGATSVDTWDGCVETVICNSPKGSLTAAEVDANDIVRGTCSSVVKH